MLEFGADHVSCRGKIDQPQSIIGRHIMKAKYSFLVHLGIEVTKHNFDIVTGAALIGLIQELIKEELVTSSFSFVGARQASIKIFWSNADCGETPVHSFKMQNNVA